MSHGLDPLSVEQACLVPSQLQLSHTCWCFASSLHSVDQLILHQKSLSRLCAAGPISHCGRIFLYNITELHNSRIAYDTLTIPKLHALGHSCN